MTMRGWLAITMLVVAVQAQAAARKIETVAATGKADYKTVQEAVDAAPDGDVVIRIAPGEYRQKVHITAPMWSCGGWARLRRIRCWCGTIRMLRRTGPEPRRA